MSWHQCKGAEWVVVLSMLSCCRQLIFSLCSGVVTTRTWFWLFYLYKWMFLVLWHILCLPASFLQHGYSICSYSCSMSLCSPLFLALCFLLLLLPSLSLSLSLSLLSSAVPFYLGCFPTEPWDSLSGYVHPGIACLAFQASYWVGTFWTSLSDYPPLLGVYPSVTLVKLIRIGHCCDHLGGWLNCLTFTHWLVVILKS